MTDRRLMREARLDGARCCRVSDGFQRWFWTRTEANPAGREKREYVLPARFDGTDIPGIPSTVDIDLRSTTPEELVDLIIEKLNGAPSGATGGGLHYVHVDQALPVQGLPVPPDYGHHRGHRVRPALTVVLILLSAVRQLLRV